MSAEIHLAGFVGQVANLRATQRVPRQPAPFGHSQTPGGGLPTRRRLTTCPTLQVTPQVPHP